MWDVRTAVCSVIFLHAYCQWQWNRPSEFGLLEPSGHSNCEFQKFGCWNLVPFSLPKIGSQLLKRLSLRFLGLMMKQMFSLHERTKGRPVWHLDSCRTSRCQKNCCHAEANKASPEIDKPSHPSALRENMPAAHVLCALEMQQYAFFTILFKPPFLVTLLVWCITCALLLRYQTGQYAYHKRWRKLQ